MISHLRRITSASGLPVIFLVFLLSLISLVGCQSTHGKHHIRKVGSLWRESSPRRPSMGGEIQSELGDLETPKEAPAPAEIALAKTPEKSADAKKIATDTGAMIGKTISGPATSAMDLGEGEGEIAITTKSATKSKNKLRTLEALPFAANRNVDFDAINSEAFSQVVTHEPLKKLKGLESSDIELSSPSETPLIFDIPVTYNERVRVWIRYFQSEGRSTFKNWLEKSSRFLPVLQYELRQAGLPQDLVFVAMIESGFTPHAASHAGAKGMWQFIVPTAERYGLAIDWWIDERQDFHKSTMAAIRYMTDLNHQFNSWYLVAASYNMGENGVRRLVQRYRTNNFWELAERGALPQETTDYVPKIIAAMLIAKAPALYGFRDLNYQMPLSFESISVPGGTDIVNLAAFLGVSEKYLKDLNPELIKGFIPRTVRSHRIRVPKGSMLAVSQFIRLQARND